MWEEGEAQRTVGNVKKKRAKTLITPMTFEKWKEYFRQLITEHRKEFGNNGRSHSMGTTG